MARHTLVSEGAPHDADGNLHCGIFGVNTAGPGRGKCSCGALSDQLPSGYARRKWHRQHKVDADASAPAMSIRRCSPAEQLGHIAEHVEAGDERYEGVALAVLLRRVAADLADAGVRDIQPVSGVDDFATRGEPLDDDEFEAFTAATRSCRERDGPRIAAAIEARISEVPQFALERTHWDGCWTRHSACALRLAADIARGVA